MTQDEIIAMAKKAGWTGIYSEWSSPTERTHLTVPVTKEQIERFANLVAAHEREACAKLCETISIEWEDQPDYAQVELSTMMDCALAIRARGQA